MKSLTYVGAMKSYIVQRNTIILDEWLQISVNKTECDNVLWSPTVRKRILNWVVSFPNYGIYDYNY